MIRYPQAWLATVLALTLAMITAPGLAPVSEEKDDAKDIAVKVTTAGALMFDMRDAKGLAATYTDDARLEIIGRDAESSPLKIETKTGRAEIEAYYENHFKGDSPIHAKNTVEHARLLEPDVLLISGSFVPDTQAENPLKLPFVQVRQRVGDAWKIVNIQVFILLKK
jgi:hypothetical protein